MKEHTSHVYLAHTQTNQATTNSKDDDGILSSISLPETFTLQAPTLLLPSIFGKKKKAFVSASPTACHSVAITKDGNAYGWGRNETGQLSLGYGSACVPVPAPLIVGGDEGVKFVQVSFRRLSGGCAGCKS